MDETSSHSGPSLDLLRKRSALLKRLREFFWQRDFIEVETPLLAQEIIPELHIEPLSVHSDDGLCQSPDSTTREARWLQSSPELHMKRLLAAGLKSIFQITRSFRCGERGRLHNPEFTIVEWYRAGDDLFSGIALLEELCQRLLSTSQAVRSSYAEVFKQHVGICPHTSSTQELGERAATLGVAVPEGMQRDDRDDWLNLLLATQVEPKLGHNGPVIVYDYPASQAALAKTVTRSDGTEVAQRFELYWQGVELANGYDELTETSELRRRLTVVNTARERAGRNALPLPENLLMAMESGLPQCSGCALGLDRLVMLECNARSLSDVIAYCDKC